MAVFRVSKNDSEDLGFAVSCLFSGAITRDEFTAWVYWVIEKADHDLPGFFFELDDFGPYLKDIYAAIGFTPSYGPSDSEIAALQGIGYKRGSLQPSVEAVRNGEKYSPARAAACLSQNPDVESRFQAAFPFLDADPGVTT